MNSSHQIVLVSGGAGFIGSHIVEYLLVRGNVVRVLDNFSTGKKENLSHLPGQERLEVIEGDISNFSTVLTAMENVQYVFHEAALVSVPLSIQQPQTSFNCNTVGTFNVFEAARCKNIRRLVFASSASIYGINNVLPLKESEPYVPMSPYALDKVYAEQLAKLYYQLYGLSSVALRYFNVYGPRQDPKSPYSGVLSIFADRLSKKEQPYIYGDGEQTRDFIYVKDVVNANIRVMEMKGKGAFVFNVGTGKSISINQLIEKLQCLFETYLNPQYLSVREGDIRHSCADISCLREWLSWQPEWGIEEGLKAYLTDGSSNIL